MLKPSRVSLFFVISGPAGSGKTTLCKRMLETFGPHVQRVITCTTRAPREGEVEGHDYYYLTTKEFQKRLSEKAFYEHARVHGQLYGTLKSEIQTKLKANVDLLLNIDVQGANSLRQAAENDAFLKQRLVTIFILPTSLAELEKRLHRRGQDTPAAIEQRLSIAADEMKHYPLYDYCIRSGPPEEDFANLQALYKAEKLRVRLPIHPDGTSRIEDAKAAI